MEQEKLNNKVRCKKCVNRMYVFCPCQREVKDLLNLKDLATKLIDLYKFTVINNPGSEVIRELSDEIKKCKIKIRELA